MLTLTQPQTRPAPPIEECTRLGPFLAWLGYNHGLTHKQFLALSPIAQHGLIVAFRSRLRERSQMSGVGCQESPGPAVTDPRPLPPDPYAPAPFWLEVLYVLFVLAVCAALFCLFIPGLARVPESMDF